MGQNSIISPFFVPKGNKNLGRSPPQELEVGPHSGPYLSVPLKFHNGHRFTKIKSFGMMLNYLEKKITTKNS